jgi:antitoxin Phd
MMRISLTKFKNRSGQYLEAAIREPIIIEKSGRPISVIISYDEYQRFLALEDKVWVTDALQAEKEGYLGTKKSVKFIKKLEKKIVHDANFSVW